MADKTVVQFRDVTKRIGSRTIIDNMTLDIPAGQVYGFLGPNGAGKTTTIRMMVGLSSISAGDIWIEGKSISKSFEQAVRHIGAIVENPEMYKFMTGYQNLTYFARMMPNITRERIDEVVRLVGLERRIDDKVKTYSLGMRQRLGVAQAIMHRPSLLVLDEPTNGLDPAGIRELRDYLRALAREEGTTVFVSSHMLSEMELMCDRVAIIQNGRLIDERSVHDAGRYSGIVQAEFEVDRPDAALDALSGSWTEASVSADGQRLIVEADRERIAEANAQLVQAGIKVYGIRTLTKSLEDQFLEMTGSEQIV
ncbi:Bacitracin transport ATP-binding protein BcrA [Paenibacillus sp. CECT 9249]|uniref:ABC transporter ATP-binding protein n=1 Tax=Paenibacillus sp. CECT 9249 TaxID=2845385 RepID=UPI001E4CCF81|nr:ABC transporter ATP-binding protein [Paenibacillus sp. CECT 9249]CAH0119393.1 Bacitracin transport ATP-binding protein BcrA [Paenibacillus sp. CECT 9249]